MPLIQRRRTGQPALVVRDSSADEVVPAATAMFLVESSAVALDCPDFGLRLGNAQDPTALGPLALVAQNAPTIREMIESAAQYLFIHSQSMKMSLLPAGLEFPGHSALEFDVQVVPRPPSRQGTDLALATAHRLPLHAVGEAYRPRAVLLPHTPAAPLSRYVRYFGAEVHPERAFGVLIVSDDLLDRPLVNVDDTIRRVAIGYLETQYPPAGQTTAEAVQSVMARYMGSRGPMSLDDVSRALALHPRTLQRRLARDGVTFADLSDARLKELARQYLVDSTVPLAQVAQALRLSDQSALTRAAKRWFGRTPSQLRRA